MGRLCVNWCGLPGASVWQMVPHSCNTVHRWAEGLRRRFEWLLNWDQRKICFGKCNIQNAPLFKTSEEAAALVGQTLMGKAA
ncbi:hypothetical protein ACD578_06165 [Microvirga sp. RSM25]|jgi:hypothetical protein|uniref:hypothetical protein n=1 Tax=Microvirga sp. RSM25 TaxID=3273802 RepID=UPI00384FAADC